MNIQIKQTLIKIEATEKAIDSIEERVRQPTAGDFGARRVLAKRQNSGYRGSGQDVTSTRDSSKAEKRLAQSLFWPAKYFLEFLPKPLTSSFAGEL